MSAEDFEGIKELAKRNHTERVAKTPERIQYALDQLAKNEIEFTLKNSQTGHFHARSRNGKLYQFWASTGKILGCETRGIHNFIKLLLRD